MKLTQRETDTLKNLMASMKKQERNAFTAGAEHITDLVAKHGAPETLDALANLNENAGIGITIVTLRQLVAGGALGAERAAKLDEHATKLGKDKLRSGNAYNVRGFMAAKVIDDPAIDDAALIRTATAQFKETTEHAVADKAAASALKSMGKAGKALFEAAEPHVDKEAHADAHAAYLEGMAMVEKALASIGVAKD